MNDPPGNGQDSDEEEPDPDDVHLQALLARDIIERTRAAQEQHADGVSGGMPARGLGDQSEEIAQDELDNEDNIPALSRLENVRTTQSFIQLIKDATYENGNLDDEMCYRLRNPLERTADDDVADPNVRYSLDLFLAITNSAQETYTTVREATLRRHPDDPILSYHEVTKLVEDVTGVVGVSDDMCINSCLCFVGPYKDDSACKECGEPRYDQSCVLRGEGKVARQTTVSILLGFVLQALHRTVPGSQAMQYLKQKMDQYTALVASLDPALAGEDMVYDDLLTGSQFWDLVERYNISGDDSVVGLSLDGLQLYQNKKSDTWIFIWIIYSIHPESRYKQRFVFPGGVINGPNKPKILDSFLFRSLHHLSAIQRENNGKGLRVWDATQQRSFDSKTVFTLATADAVGLPEVDGRVGHHGARACRLGCPMKGRHKPGVGHYYAPHLRPHNFPVPDCDHPDIDIRNLPISSPEQYQLDISSVCSAHDASQYKAERKRTGISKPSILLGLFNEQSFPVPACFGLDLMHLCEINIQDLLISLWRGTIDCEPTDSKDLWDWMVLKGQTWKDHGQDIADATKYFPTSFH